MKRIFFSILALSCVLIFSARAPAQQHFENNDPVIQNLCIPDEHLEFEEHVIYSGLNFDEVERVRIELLERGYNPDFDPNRDNTVDPELMDALTQFQAENELPVTGLPDDSTLTALGIPVPEN
jgi:hypothetical protein